jgi:probable phosphoglycerate mutase
MNGNLFEMNAPSGGEWFTAHCDGGSRGNPGPSGYGAVVEDAQGGVVAELSEYLGKQTNNYAEYHGLLAALKWSLENGVKHLRVISDSELMVKQMKGQYKVNSPGLRPLWEEAKSLSRHFERFEIRHTLRGGNKEADRLANEAMDRGMGRAAGGASEPADRQVSESASQRSKSTGPQIGRTAISAAHCAAPAPAAKPTRQILEGYVKDGVVHLLGSELPDGIFVKIIRE